MILKILSWDFAKISYWNLNKESQQNPKLNFFKIIFLPEKIFFCSNIFSNEKYVSLLSIALQFISLSLYATERRRGFAQTP